MRRYFPLPSINFVLIRQATPEDIPHIRALECESETAAHWAEREYSALFSPDAPRRVALVARSDTGAELQGFAIARCLSQDWEIENVVVAPERRRLGIGSALVAEVVQRARIGGATSVLLEVRESNVAALRLYETLGFSPIGRRPGYYREPLEAALLLKISISVL